MKVPNKVNQVRRRVMHSLTKRIGNTSKVQTLNAKEVASIKKVLVIRPNHRLGNMLLTTPLIQEITSRFPHAKIDVLAKGGLAPIVLQNFEAVHEIIQFPKRPFSELLNYIGVWLKMTSRHYDLTINAVKGSSSGKLLTLISRSKHKVYQNPEDDINNLEPTHNAKEAIYALRHVFPLNSTSSESTAIPLLDLKLSEVELKKGKEVLTTLVDITKPTIAIFTYATGHKCYPPSWWNPFYERIKEEFSECNILEILPVENVSQINFKATSYYTKDIREMAAVMANCSVFVGADSGIMHLASASGVPTIGLFTGRIDNYTPYGHLNCAVDTNKTDLSHWIKKMEQILNSESLKHSKSQF